MMQAMEPEWTAWQCCGSMSPWCLRLDLAGWWKEVLWWPPLPMLFHLLLRQVPVSLWHSIPIVWGISARRLVGCQTELGTTDTPVEPAQQWIAQRVWVQQKPLADVWWQTEGHICFSTCQWLWSWPLSWGGVPNLGVEVLQATPFQTGRLVACHIEYEVPRIGLTGQRALVESNWQRQALWWEPTSSQLGQV